MNNKIALGTVKFGLNYGINNKTGILSKDEIYELLIYANKNGINTLDTAYNYGNSEKKLGEILNKTKSDFKIISKAPKGTNKENLFNYVYKSLATLRIHNFYGYLLHDFNDYLTNKNIIDSFNILIEKEKVKKIGFSLYHPEQLDRLINDGVSFDLVQIPYNLVDRRFEKYFKTLKEWNVEIHVRSVFLQGLFFMKHDKLPEKLTPFRDFLKKINSFSIEMNRSIENISLNFVLQNSYINKAVIGVDTLNQLQKNIDESKNIINSDEMDMIISELSKIKLSKELLIPSNWN